MPFDNFWLLAGISLAAGLVSGVAGFGYSLVAVGLFSMVMPVSQATVLASIASLVTAGLNLWTVRRSVVWKEVLPILAVSMPATVLGVYLLSVLSESLLRAGVGLITLVGCAATVWCPNRAYIRRAFPWGYILGLLSGIFSGTLSTGGPPLVIYTLLRCWDKAQAKALLAACFLVTNIWRLTLLTSKGVASPRAWTMGLWLLIPAILTTYLGTTIFSRMSTRVFRYTTMGLLVALSARLLLS